VKHIFCVVVLFERGCDRTRGGCGRCVHSVARHETKTWGCNSPLRSNGSDRDL